MTTIHQKYLLHLERNFQPQQLQRLQVRQDPSPACLEQRLGLRLAHILILGLLVHIWGLQEYNWGQLGHNLPSAKGQVEVLVHIWVGFGGHNWLLLGHCSLISGLGQAEVPGHIG